MNTDDQAEAEAERARQQQDEIAAETGFDDPHFDDDGRPLEYPTKADPETKRGRGFPLGQKRPERDKGPYTQVRLSLADDCLEYLRFLKENGNAGSITAAVEMCIRGDRAAQRVPAKK